MNDEYRAQVAQVRVSDKHMAELRDAQHRARKMFGHLGIAILKDDSTKQIGTLILPEIHRNVRDNYWEVEGVKVLAEGKTWQEVFSQLGV